ncbi:tripartite motif-containing protein 14 [Discoglossus pictus]
MLPAGPQGLRTPPGDAPCGLCGSGCPVPVLMVSCRHRFCLACLEGFWQRVSAPNRPCPVCTSPAGCRRPVPTPQCDLCPPHSPCIARWSCLTCRESYCPEHFQPHMMEEEQEGGGLAGHQVCEAAGEEARSMREARSEKQRCLEHMERAVELYCAVCRVCVCTMCPLLGTHRGHPVTLIQQEAQHKRYLTSRCLEQLDQKTENVLGNIRNIEQAADDLKARTLASSDSLTGKFTELRLLLDEEEKLAKKFIEDKTQHALRAYNEQIESCQEHISVIDQFSGRVRLLEHEHDAVQLIQKYTAAEKEMQTHMSPAEQWHPVPVTFDNVENYVSAFLESIKASLKKPLGKRLHKGMFNSLSVTSNQRPGSIIKTKMFVERPLFLKHARCPALDPDTMHPRLRLSEDRLAVHCAWFSKFNSSDPQRFDKLLQVMSRDSYFSGSHYWEVDLLQAGQGWWIGITYPSIQRKGDSEFSRLGWNSASWCIKRYDAEYWAFHKAERIPLHLDNTPERIGLFLDYESGILSFFDVTGGMKHLHTFRCRFTEPLYPALRLWDGTVTMCRLN